MSVDKKVKRHDKCYHLGKGTPSLLCDNDILATSQQHEFFDRKRFAKRLYEIMYWL